MKRILSYLAMAVAVLLVIVFTAIPHHHHKEMMCMTMERCELDNSYNDEHTSHSDEGQGEDNCSASANLTTTESFKDQSAQTVDGYQPIFIPILFALSDLWKELVKDEIQPTYADYRVNYTSALLGEVGGLRAPPCL